MNTIIRYCLLLILFFYFGIKAQTDTLNIYWDPNPEPDMYQYELFRSVNSITNFQLIQTLFHPDTHAVDSVGIQPGNQYAYRLSAVDSSGLHSGFSQIASVGLPVINWTLSTIFNNLTTSVSLQNIISDPDNNWNEMQISISGETNVQLTVTTDSLLITPVPLTYTGPASFTMSVTDPSGFWDQKNIQFTFVNYSPLNFVLHIPQISFPEDGQYTLWLDTCVTISPYAPNELIWSFSGLDNINANYIPLNRLVTFSSQQPNWFGTDTIIFQATAPNDSVRTSAEIITINPVNDPPQAANDNGFTPKNTPLTIDVLANDTDPDGDTLTVSTVTQGSNGSVVINSDETVTYTPNTNFVGNDLFSYQVSDGNGGLDTADVTVQVNQLNYPPIAGDDSTVTDEDLPVTIDVLANDNDPDGDSLQIHSFTQPDSGQVSANANATLQYAPNLNFHGTDNFSYIITDGLGGFDTANVTITINPVNDPPIAVNDYADTTINTSITINILNNDSDPDNDPLTVTAVTPGSNGTTVINTGGTVTYTPDNGFMGADTFSYRISDGNGGVDSADVIMKIGVQNTLPLAGDDSAVTDEDITVAINVLANDSDPDGDSLHIHSFTQPDSGTVTLSPDSKLLYTSNLNYFGVDNFTYIVTDGFNGFDTATVVVTVNPVNDPPVLSLSQLYISPISLNIFDLKPFATDVEQIPQELEWHFNGYTHFSISWHDSLNKLIKINNLDGTLNETGNFVVSDPEGASDTAAVTLYYNPTQTNTPPSLSQLPASFAIVEDSSGILELYQFVYDSTNNFYDLSIEFDPGDNLHYNYEPITGKVTIYADSNFSGLTSMEIKVKDPSGASDQKNLIVRVKPRVDLATINFSLISNVDVVVNISTDIPSRGELMYKLPSDSVYTTRGTTSFKTQYSLSLTSLKPDTIYHCTLTLEDTSGFQKTALDTIFSTIPDPISPEDLGKELIVFPNPFRLAKGHEFITFKYIPQETASVIILTPLGEIIYEKKMTDTAPPYWEWAVENEDHEKIASGFYIYILKGTNGKKIKSGKIAVIR